MVNLCQDLDHHRVILIQNQILEQILMVPVPVVMIILVLKRMHPKRVALDHHPVLDPNQLKIIRHPLYLNLVTHHHPV